MNTAPTPLLIVEDSPVYADILLHLLPSLGADLPFASVWVDTAEKAITELACKQFKLVFLDYKLPGADGLSLLAHIQLMPEARRPAVIMLTGIGREEVAVEAMKSGAKDYLSKDHIDIPSLVRAITGALSRKHTEDALALTSEELALKNSQMQADLKMAREIQEAFLPSTYPTFPPTVTPEQSALLFHHRYLPAVGVGGDFFDIIPINDHQAGVLICDVMGHGVRAALITAILRALIEQHKPHAHDPGAFLQAINQTLFTLLNQTRMPVFATAFYLIADTHKHQLRYANAGHPSPCRIHHDNAQYTSQNKPGSALGVFVDSTYNLTEAPLDPGDTVLLYTDGLFEAEGTDKTRYGQERLLASIQRHAALPTAALLDNILDDIKKFTVTPGFHDDLCLVSVEVKKLINK
jgi:sigma-B regulation protein RsbU (phosphoserine phosphatase)